VQGAPQEKPDGRGAGRLGWALAQIVVLDIIFSLDSVITAVGMAQQLWVMAVAVVLAVGVMLAFSGPISAFVHRHPSLQMLALSFLILIGVMLVAEGVEKHIRRGYIYFAMAFSLVVELLNLRLRKQPAPAAPDFKKASAFMDYDVFPNVLDYQGPNGMVQMRRAIFQVTLPVTDRLFVAAAVEQPYSDIQWFEDGEFVVNPGNGIITTAGAPRNVQDMPDFTSNVRYETDFGHVQAAGILRKLTFQPSVGPDMNRLGYGTNLTGDLHPWALLMQSNPLRKDNPTALERCRILGGSAVGRGINRYLQDTNGLGLDAVSDPLDGFRSLYSVGWFACYEHWWTEKWLSNVCYSHIFTDLPAAMPPDTYRGGKYLAVNLIWLPLPKLGFGIEYLYGEREDKDGDKGFAHRNQAGVQYSF
jgi:hypothetical protein